jgi:hypothetical protein
MVYMSRLALIVSFLVCACGGKDKADGKPAASNAPATSSTAAAPAASSQGYGTVEDAVRAFNSALESGDATAIRGQFPSRAAYASHVSPECADGWDKMFAEWASTLPKNGDVQAMKGRASEFVKLDAADTTGVQAGAEGDGCKFTKALAFVKTSSTWKLEGENHQTKLTLVQLDGRYYVFDLPGM